jgi:hypothetical protein
VATPATLLTNHPTPEDSPASTAGQGRLCPPAAAGTQFLLPRRRTVGRRPWRTWSTLRELGGKNFRSCFHAHGNSGFSTSSFACRLEVGLVLATDRLVRRRADSISARRRTDFDSQPSRAGCASRARSTLEPAAQPALLRLGRITGGWVGSRIFDREMTH